MAVRKTVQIGEPVLRETAVSVTDITNFEIQASIADLVETMRNEGLIGIAAPQVGESLRIFVSEVRETEFRSKEDADPLTIYINPKITHVSHETETDYEGCGSILSSGIFGKVKRAR